MIKPEFVEIRNTGYNFKRIEEGLELRFEKVHLFKEKAGKFYEIHKENLFIRELVIYEWRTYN